MKWNRLLTTVLMLGIIPAGALAGGAPPPPLPPAGSITNYDADGDGVLSESEKVVMKAALAAQRRGLIAKYDTDGDGALNAAERAAMQAELTALRLAEQAAKFAALDLDGSNDLSLNEFAAGAPVEATMERIQAAFARMDADGNNAISLAEFTAHPTPAPGADKAQPPPGKPRRGSGSRGTSVAMAR